MPPAEVERPVVGWESAIAEAQAQIDAAQRRIWTLKAAISTFERNLAAGEPWPGSEKK